MDTRPKPENMHGGPEHHGGAGDIEKFISQARAKSWDDAQITQALSASGWSQHQIQAGLSGLVIPAPPVGPAGAALAAHDSHSGRPSISALQAALHHVLLWLFTGTSTVMITTVSLALFAQGSGSSETLLTYIVLELVTFVPFAFLYWRYLQRMRVTPDIMTGRVWSIITVVLHSIGLVGAAIGLVLVLVLVHNGDTMAGVMSSLAIGAIDALVVVAYVSANFAKDPDSRLRKRYLWLFPAALFVVVASLAVLALVRVGPLRVDDQTMQNLSTAGNKVSTYAGDHQALPDSFARLGDLPAGVSYQKLSAGEYQLCASFKASHGTWDFADPQDDSYIDSTSFDGGSAGHHCWKFTDDNVQTGEDNEGSEGAGTGGTGSGILPDACGQTYDASSEESVVVSIAAGKIEVASPGVTPYAYAIAPTAKFFDENCKSITASDIHAGDTVLVFSSMSAGGATTIHKTSSP